MKGKKTMKKKKNINLTLSKKSESHINAFMTMLDQTFKLGKQDNKNLTYKQNVRNSLTVFLSNEWKPKMNKELN